MKKFLLLLIASIGVIIALRMTVEDVSAFSQIVRDMGYEVGDTPIETVELVIPENFSPVYEKYNNMLKENGYDLSLYKGKKCTRYSYLIPSLNARANILVHNGKIIGGDISGITLDGIMIPIKKTEKSSEKD